MPQCFQSCIEALLLESKLLQNPSDTTLATRARKHYLVDPEEEHLVPLPFSHEPCQHRAAPLCYTPSRHGPTPLALFASGLIPSHYLLRTPAAIQQALAIFGVYGLDSGCKQCAKPCISMLTSPYILTPAVVPEGTPFTKVTRSLEDTNPHKLKRVSMV